MFLFTAYELKICYP